MTDSVKPAAADKIAAAQRDRPWLFRTYSGHSSATASNALYRTNLARGQTGLSVAFDLPTQTGYDSDHPLAIGEVGKVGVPIGHLGDMRALLDGIPLDRMNTSMTINATAPWLLALYIAVADETGAARKPPVDRETVFRAFDMFGAGSDEEFDAFRSGVELAAQAYLSYRNPDAPAWRARDLRKQLATLKASIEKTWHRKASTF